MAQITYRSPSTKVYQNPPLELLKGEILEASDELWRNISGDADLEYVSPAGKAQMLILPDEVRGIEAGIYLKYFDVDDNCWLSLADADNLHTVTYCYSEWEASVGLFLPREQAWLAIEDFYRTGERSRRIEWILPSQIPDDGYWCDPIVKYPSHK